MSLECTVSYETPPTAMRVFQGYQNPQLSPADFLRDVGQTFMPGTPYMLAPLGCAAYIAGVIVADEPELPNEFALIAYPSPEVWQYASTTTLRGRLYTQTHAGVYEVPRSHADFPVRIDDFAPGSPKPYYLADELVDWQLGVTAAIIGAKQNRQQPALEFLSLAWDTVRAARGSLDRDGVDQMIVMPGETFVIAWAHFRTPPDDAVLQQLGAMFSGPLVRHVATVPAERVVCRDEPPAVTLRQTSAYNFVFLREPRFFLR
jgi:hypothetical protein